jgi:hypothetical protein
VPDGNAIKEAIRTLIQQELAALQAANLGQQSNLVGVVSQVNTDGTVNVDTASGTYQGVGTPIVRVLGEKVIVVTSQEGTRVAL